MNLAPHTDTPWTYQLELVQGCNRICGFCGINAIRTAPGNYKYMSEDTLGAACAQIAEFTPTTKIDFAMHGEPLQHRDYLRMFSIARSLLPKAQLKLVTNGKVLMKKMQHRVESIFAAGIDIIHLDTYYPERDDMRAEVATLTGFDIIDFYADKERVKAVSPYMNHHRKVQRTIFLFDDLGAVQDAAAQRAIHNHAGSNPQLGDLRAPLAKTCTKPFRELSIEYDGVVNLCCEDWLRRYVVGNVNETPIPALWYGPKMEAARAMLQNKRRDFAACKVCDAGSGMRVGFLPKYEPVSTEQEAIVRQTEGRDTYEPAQLVQLRTKA